MAGRHSSSSSRSKSPSRTSRSRSKNRSHSRSRSRSYSRTRRSSTPYDRNRLHISDIGWGISKRDLEHVFEGYGRLVEVWQSRTVPAFAFVVFRKDEDAAEALRATDGMTLHGSRIHVSFARPRAYERRKVGPITSMRCYSCNRKGHFSRDCPESMYGYRRPPSRGGGRMFRNGSNYYRPRSPLTRRYHSRGRSRSRDRRSSTRSHSRSRDRSYRGSNRRSGSVEHKRRRSRSNERSKLKDKRSRSDSRANSRSKKHRSASKDSRSRSRSKSDGKRSSRSASASNNDDPMRDEGMLKNSISPCHSKSLSPSMKRDISYSHSKLDDERDSRSVSR